jgi:hypothetical protein
MKNLFAGLLAIIILIVAACNNNKQDDKHDQHEHDNMHHDSMNNDKMPMDSMKDMKHDSMTSMNHSSHEESMPGMNADISATKTAITNMDLAVKNYVNSIIRRYLSVKNGLAKDNNLTAKNEASQLLATIRKFDKSLFSMQQKNEFDKHIGDVKDQLQAIASNDNIEGQRSSFSMLSMHLYELAKVFGTGQVLYYDHCPMALNNTGANWLSETKEIQNPYMGSSMISCGTVKEVIQ